MSNSRNDKLEINPLSIDDLIKQLSKDLKNWENRQLERLGDLIEFELMDRLNRLEFGHNDIPDDYIDF